MYCRFTLFTNATISIFIVVVFYYCKGIKAPAPDGINGEYSFTSGPPVYIANGITKDSILKVLVKENLSIKGGRLNDYDAPWDSLRYLFDNIPCGEQIVEAYVQFNEEKATNITFKVLWFNAEPTNDNKEYQKRTVVYYKCFDSLLRKNNLIK